MELAYYVCFVSVPICMGICGSHLLINDGLGLGCGNIMMIKTVYHIIGTLQFLLAKYLICIIGEMFHLQFFGI